MKKHTVLGYQIFCQYWHDSDNKFIKLIGESILHHHECFNGSGYPDGISISSLSTITSIISICDVYSALLSNRCYKPAYSPEEALEILEKGKKESSLIQNYLKNFCFCPKRKLTFRKNKCF